MTMIFVGGCEDIMALPEPVTERIGAIVTKEFGVLVGDRPGADEEVQCLLAGYRYDHVGVFHAGTEPRNNLGDWAAYYIPAPEGAHGFAAEAEKDREMVRMADYGLMVWDGESPGTLLNIYRLALKATPCVVYNMARRQAPTINTLAHWRVLLRAAGPDTAQEVLARMSPDERADLDR